MKWPTTAICEYAPVRQTKVKSSRILMHSNRRASWSPWVGIPYSLLSTLDLNVLLFRPTSFESFGTSVLSSGLRFLSLHQFQEGFRKREYIWTALSRRGIAGKLIATNRATYNLVAFLLWERFYTMSWLKHVKQTNINKTTCNDGYYIKGAD